MSTKRKRLCEESSIKEERSTKEKARDERG